MKAWLERVLINPEVEFVPRLVSDDRPAILAALEEMSGLGCCLILTTGGTGPAPRDVTPEATEQFCEKLLPGFGEQMRRASLEVVPTAILSRQTAGTSGSTMVINLPGKPSAIDDCLNAVFAAVPYGIDLIGGARLETDPEIFPVFRPGEKKGLPSQAQKMAP